MTQTDAASEVRSERQELGGLINAPTWPNPISWREAVPGEQYSGKVTRIGQIQQRDYDTGELQTWPSGQALMVDVIVLNDGEQEISWFVQGQSATRAFRQAMSDAKVTGLAVGDFLTIEFAHAEDTIDRKTGKPSKTLSPTKIFNVYLTPVS